MKKLIFTILLLLPILSFADVLECGVDHYNGKLVATSITNNKFNTDDKKTIYFSFNSCWVVIDN